MRRFGQWRPGGATADRYCVSRMCHAPRQPLRHFATEVSLKMGEVPTGSPELCITSVARVGGMAMG